MKKFNVPTRDEVSAPNQAIFDKLESSVGFVPNLYAYYAKNETALGDYLGFQGRKSTLKTKEKELINLVVSEYHACTYCLSAHTQLGKMNGFTEEQILQLRTGNAPFDSKLNALSQFVLSTLQNRGKATTEAKENLFSAGYDEANMIDIAIAIGTKSISNFIHNLTDFEIDFPLAVELSAQPA